MDIISLIKNYEVNNNKKMIVIYNYQINYKLYRQLREYFFTNRDQFKNEHFDILFDISGGNIDAFFDIVELLKDINCTIYIPHKGPTASSIIASFFPNVFINESPVMNVFKSIEKVDSIQSETLIVFKLNNEALVQILNGYRWSLSTFARHVKVKLNLFDIIFYNIGSDLFNQKGTYAFSGRLPKIDIETKRIPADIKDIYDTCKVKFGLGSVIVNSSLTSKL